MVRQNKKINENYLQDGHYRVPDRFSKYSLASRPVNNDCDEERQ